VACWNFDRRFRKVGSGIAIWKLTDWADVILEIILRDYLGATATLDCGTESQGRDLYSRSHPRNAGIRFLENRVVGMA
jgi:hypothetical protein